MAKYYYRKKHLPTIRRIPDESWDEVEHIRGSGTRFYLSKDAQMIAKGALRIYPELKDI